MRSLIVLGWTVVVVAVTALAAVGLAVDDKKDLDVGYVPTPRVVVEKMLELARVTKDDVLYDLGCGDGRIVCTAARKYKCKAVGFDLDPERIKDSEANKAKEDREVQKLITFENKDIFKLDLSKASVITLYLLPKLNVRLVPQLEKMKKGSRIVSHGFDMEGYKPDQKIIVMSGDLERDLFLWTIPLKKDTTKKKE
jgi:precorrin-6B methylase 2